MHICTSLPGCPTKLMKTTPEKLTAFDGRNKLIVADLEIDLHSSRVTRSGVQITLSVTQFRILLYLAAHPGTVISKSALNAVLDKQPPCSNSNAIDVHIARLRRRIDQDFFPNLIHTERKKGYFLSEAIQKKRHAFGTEKHTPGTDNALYPIPH